MSGLDCNELVELVTDFLEGALDPEAERCLIDHLTLCDGCGTYVEQMRTTVLALGAMPSDGLPDTVRRALLLEFRRDWESR